MSDVAKQIADRVRGEFDLTATDENGPEIDAATLQAILYRAAHMAGQTIERGGELPPKLEVK